MSAEAAACVRSWPVGRYRVTLSIRKPVGGSVLSAVAEWEPTMPTKLTPGEVESYLAGRRRALAELSQELGISALVIDV